jgi:hypothetical protein
MPGVFINVLPADGKICWRENRFAGGGPGARRSRRFRIETKKPLLLKHFVAEEGEAV